MFYIFDTLQTEDKMAFIIQAAIVLVIAIIIAYYTITGPFWTPSILSEQLDEEYDYIVVGGGSAGSVVASRLSEDTDKKVLLLEAGGHYDENPLLHIPAAWLILQKTEHDWGYYTEPQNVSCLGMNDQRAYWPRGRVLGGSGMLNAMQYTRGSRHDFDEWARNGCTGWSYKDVLPYFLKSEDVQIDDLKSSVYHSTGGPLAVSDCRVTPLADFYMKACEELGYRITDYNGGEEEGCSGIQINVRNGLRSSTSVEYLDNTAERENLHIAVRSFVTNVKIEKKKATGVYVMRKGKISLIKARKEIILSAGAINTPQILMLSGVGPERHISSLGIDLKADLPVGENLQDHVMVWMFSRINSSHSITTNLRESMWSKLNYQLFGKGPISIAGSDGNAFLYTDESKRGKTYPDIQIVFYSSFLNINSVNLKNDTAEEYLARTPNEEGFTTSVILTHPKSNGTVKLKSSDPFEHPVLDPQFFTNKEDIIELTKGIKEWEKIVDTPTMKSLGVKIDQSKLSFCSQHEFRSDAYWECYIRHLGVTVWHQCGTCKMGSDKDPSTVVDPQLRVKGIKGLRVVDASVFPKVTSGNINAPVVMLAEKAADMIRGIDSVKAFKRNLPNNI